MERIPEVLRPPTLFDFEFSFSQAALRSVLVGHTYCGTHVFDCSRRSFGGDSSTSARSGASVGAVGSTGRGRLVVALSSSETGRTKATTGAAAAVSVGAELVSWMGAVGSSTSPASGGSGCSSSGGPSCSSSQGSSIIKSTSSRSHGFIPSSSESMPHRTAVEASLRAGLGQNLQMDRNERQEITSCTDQRPAPTY